MLRHGEPVGIITRRDVLNALTRLPKEGSPDQALRATAGTGAILPHRDLETVGR